MPPAGSPSESGLRLPASLESKIFDLLPLSVDARAAQLDDLCRQHPAHAEAIRARFAVIDLVERSLAEHDPQLGETVGPYRILSLLGTGGMGVVYLAEQREPVRRRVALKLILLGRDTKEVLARFEIERQALALMNHPGIAKVLDAGCTRDGRPFFAMEHVPGLPITTFCDRDRLPLGERLHLFLLVCGAIQHAHQKGIIHRDIKPSNVLVQMQDGIAVPKVIDFGVAKAIDQRLTERTVFTEDGRMIGTPAYMSPEQAEATALEVDTRTDVYSLGVLLYELISGVLPFDAKELAQASPFEVQRRLREEDPHRPSTRIDETGLGIEDAAAKRRTDAATLRRQLRGDLDWITMKALEKSPARRYQAASELAADVRRHLDHEPIAAGPPTIRYRVGKLVRRYRVQVTAAAVVLVALIGGLIASLAFYFEARAAQKSAEVTLTRLDMLAGVVRLREAIAAQKALYPPWPDTRPAMAEWFTRHADPLLAMVPALEHTRASLQQATRGGPRGRDEFLHAAFGEFLQDLQRFESHTCADVRERMAWAATVEADSIEAHRVEWTRVCAAIDADPRYGLAIGPQLGLVPVGVDPAYGWFEFVDLRSGTPGKAIPQRDPATGRLGLNADSGIVFVLLPGGEFTMGADAAHDPFAVSGEDPMHVIRLEPFFIAKYETTQSQWARLAGGSNPSLNAAGAGVEGSPERITVLHPVEQVSWQSCDTLLRQNGLVLPTEAQWEYACRAGTTTPWSCGATAESLQGYANVGDAVAKTIAPTRDCEAWSDGHFVHASVGSYAGNGFGLHDMHGNVWEWCRDRFGLYTDPWAPGDGLRQSSVDTDRRMMRGGSFFGRAVRARSSYRTHEKPSNIADNVGVRAARTLIRTP